MISCLGAPTRHLLMPRDPFQLSSVVTSQYSKIFFLEKFSGKSPESSPENLPIWVKGPDTEGVRADIRSMEEERKQIEKRVERAETKSKALSNYDYCSQTLS